MAGLLIFAFMTLLFAPRGPEGLIFPGWLGVALWLIGFFFEAVGDWQLACFKADPANRGKVMDGALWRYTRHPNYFGEAALWWGYGCLAWAAGAPWMLYSPVLLTLLVLRVSGVTMLEESLRNSMPGYAEYMKSTSAFIPMPPRD